MNRTARMLMHVAVVMSPPDRRAVRREQWASDMTYAASEGVSPASIGWGAVVAAARTYRPQLSARTAAAGSLVVAVGLVVLGGGALSPDSSRPTSVYVSVEGQRSAEQVVAQFIQSNPAPVYGADTTASWEDQLLAYWKRVPWRAVAEQWDCSVTYEPVIRRSTTADGQSVVALENGQVCADRTGAATLGAATVETRTTYLATHRDISL